MRSPLRTALLGAVVAALATIPGLGTGTLWDNSETAYGEVAREILLTHDWVVLHLNGAPWFIQPPLYFWLAAGFANAFGLEPLWLRLPAALATIAMGATIGYASAALVGRRVGIYGAVILSTSLMQAIVGRLAIMDALLDLAVAVGVLAVFRAFTGGRTVPAIVGASVAVALGILAKGPVALAVVVLVIVPWLVWERLAGARLTRVPFEWWLVGGVVCFAVVAPWFALLGSRAGSHALVELIGHYTFGRYLGTIENQHGPIWYYVPVIILGFFPWIAFLPAALVAAWRAARPPNGALTAHLARLALVWAIVPFAFFSLAKTKLPNYVALELPALAILVALWFDRVADGQGRRGAIVAAGVVPLTIGAVAIAIALYARDAHLLAGTEAVMGDLLWMGVIVFVGSIVTFAIIASGRRVEIAPYALGATAILMLAYTAIVAEPHAEPFKPVPQLAAIIRQQDRPGDAIAIQGVAGGNALVFYTRPRVFAIDMPYETPQSDDTDPKRVICSAPRAFVVASRKRPTVDPTYGRRRTPLASAANDVLFLYEGSSCH
ncbi:MAG: glycosyltransferase family 39 protein [Candidatus Eremiobacteraeota bacterium]|nr:glycosyltransferase family 39 protein [Candidatus Eremiobacteraeota bacterium]